MFENWLFKNISDLFNIQLSDGPFHSQFFFFELISCFGSLVMVNAVRNSQAFIQAAGALAILSDMREKSWNSNLNLLMDANCTPQSIDPISHFMWFSQSPDANRCYKMILTVLYLQEQSHRSLHSWTYGSESAELMLHVHTAKCTEGIEIAYDHCIFPTNGWLEQWACIISLLKNGGDFTSLASVVIHLFHSSERLH